jgi:hypothetical protein
MKKVFLAMALALFASASFAAPIFSVLHEYGTDSGRMDPGGTDVLSGGYVTVRDSSAGRFNDRFDFSAVADPVTGLELTLLFNRAGPSCPFGVCGIGETWAARIQGSNLTGTTDDLFFNLSDSLSPMSFLLNLSTDVGGINAFATSVANGYLDLWFSESSFGGDSFRLVSAGLQVFGTPTPPSNTVDAPGTLALAGLSLLLMAVPAGLRRARASNKADRFAALDSVIKRAGA